MSSLSKQLLDILDANSSYKEFQSYIGVLRDMLIQNLSELDGLGEQASQLSDQSRVAVVLKAANIFLGERAVAPHDIVYGEHVKRNWSNTCWMSPACFLIVQNALEVALILKIITHIKVQFAIRSGGHNPNPGFGGIDSSGVVIDLSAIDQIQLSNDKSYVTVGSGTTWSRVYESLEKEELTVVGGRVDGVGVGGLLLGGGMSHFSNYWGMAADNVKNFEVVLSDSQVVQANEKANTDLYKALKGGGPNFGIVTRCELLTYPNYKLWYSVKVYSAADKDRVMVAATKIQKAMDIDDKIGFFLTVAKDTLTAGMLYREWSDFPDAFHVFDGIPILMDAIPGTNGSDLSACQAFAMKSGVKYTSGTITVKPNAQTYIEHHNALCDTLKDSNSSLVFTYQPIGARAVEMIKARGGNVLGLSPEPQTWLAIVATWTHDTEDESVSRNIGLLINSIGSISQSQGELLNFQFMNDAGYYQNPLGGYGTGALEFLRSTAKKYDTKGVFQALQRSGFLLSKA